MNGRRVRADGDEDLPIHLEPGDYGFWVRGGHWVARCPHEDPAVDMPANLSAHKVVEHEDGTITVSPSILVTGHDGSWHGFLERGVWRVA